MASQSYYNESQPGPQYQNDPGYQMGPPQAQYPQQPPPNYDPNKPEPGAGPVNGGSGKQPYEQTFKLDKPKYNDLWAGIIVGLLTLTTLISLTHHTKHWPYSY